MNKRIILLTKFLITIPFFAMFSCSVQKMALNSVSDMLSKSGSSDNAFMLDDDYEFVKSSLPFAIKMYETVKLANPMHYGINVSTGSLYIMYANAFVELPSLYIEDYEKKTEQQQRAKRMYIKGADMILNYMDKTKLFKGIKDATVNAKISTLQTLLINIKSKQDLDALYWMAAGYMGAYSLDPMDFALSTRVPALVAMLEKVHEINKNYGDGGVQDLLAQIYASPLKGDMKKAKAMVDEELAITKDSSVGAYLTLASAIQLPSGKIEEGIATLQKALAVDISKYPSKTLMNVISKMRAKLKYDEYYEMLSTEGVEEEEAEGAPAQ